MLSKAGPSGEPIATPSVCLYMISLKLNSTPDVALFISSIKTAFEISGCASESSQYNRNISSQYISSQYNMPHLE